MKREWEGKWFFVGSERLMKTNVQSTWKATNCNSIDIHYTCKPECHLPHNLTSTTTRPNPGDIAIWGVKWFTPPLATQKHDNYIAPGTKRIVAATGGRLQLKRSIRAVLNGPLCGITYKEIDSFIRFSLASAINLNLQLLLTVKALRLMEVTILLEERKNRLLIWPVECRDIMTF